MPINDYSYQATHDKKLAESICVAAIAKVTAFNPGSMTVSAQPMSKRLQGGKYESQPPVLGVPVACTKSGGYIFRPWIKPGDVGLIVYLDHDMDSAVSGGKESAPSTERNHSASDAVFVGGIVSGGAALSGVPANAIALAKEDGSIFIAIEDEKISAKGDMEIEAKEKITIKGDVEIEAKDKVTIKGDVEIEAKEKITIKGDVDIDGKLTATGEVHGSNI